MYIVFQKTRYNSRKTSLFSNEKSNFITKRFEILEDANIDFFRSCQKSKFESTDPFLLSCASSLKLFAL